MKGRKLEVKSKDFQKVKSQEETQKPIGYEGKVRDLSIICWAP